LDYTPDDFEIDAEVSVNDPVTEAGDLLPRHVRVGVSQVPAQVLRRLADDFQHSDDRVLGLLFGEEGDPPVAGVCFGPLNGAADVHEPRAVVDHNGTASPRMR